MGKRVISAVYWNQWLLLAAFFTMGNFIWDWTLDIVTNDAYVVVSGSMAGFVTGGFFVILWCLFRFVSAFRSIRWLAHIHVTGTTVVTALITYALYLSVTAEPVKRNSDYSVYTEFNEPEPVNWLFLLLIAFAFLQLSWIIQLFGRTKAKKKIS